jgi:hypothetical protein
LHWYEIREGAVPLSPNLVNLCYAVDVHVLLLDVTEIRYDEAPQAGNGDVGSNSPYFGEGVG